MKKYLFFSFIILQIVFSYAQQLPNRYLDEIVSEVKISRDIIFSTNIPTVRSTNLFGNRIANEESFGEITTTLRMDIYTPSQDVHNFRPVIIFAYGGGFVNGNRNEASMVELCKAFARRGFVTATMDYRLGMNLTDTELSKRAVYRALQDGRSAVRFFRKNASAFGIDPNQIYLSGHSAGAFIAYHNVYLDTDEERPASTRNYFGRPNLGGLDDIGDNKRYNNGTRISGKANGAMGFAGAVGELSYIDGANDVPSVYFHSTDDNTVPYNAGEPFSFLSWIPGINLPVVFGSNRMKDRARSVGATNQLNSYSGRGHNVHFRRPLLYPEITSRGANFFYDKTLRPAATTITSDSCNSCSVRTYTATNDQAFYYDWQITGGTFLDRDTRSNRVTVRWNANTNRVLTVTPYSQYLARGISFSIDDDLNQNPDSCNWEQLPGLANDIGAGKGQLYVVGNNNKMYQWNNNIANWTQLGDINFKSVAVDGDGYAWAVTTGNSIFNRLGNNEWTRLRGRARDIGASRGGIYVVGTNNSAYRYSGNNSWSRIRGRDIKRIDVATNGDVWAVGTDDHVYQLKNETWSGKKGAFRAADITFIGGSNEVWAVELGTGFPHKYLGNGIWERFRGILTNISGDSNGVIFGSNANKNIFRNECFETSAKNAGFAAFEEKNTNQLIVYPNPANHIVNVRIPYYKGKIINALLTNVLGQNVLKKSFNSANGESISLDISGLGKGLYMITIQLEDQQLLTKQLMVN